MSVYASYKYYMHMCNSACVCVLWPFDLFVRARKHNKDSNNNLLGQSSKICARSVSNNNNNDQYSYNNNNSNSCSCHCRTKSAPANESETDPTATAAAAAAAAARF